MSSLPGGYSRDQLRRAYADAWEKQRARALLTSTEAMIADVIGLHPEYLPVVTDADAALSYEPGAAGGRENPFLHMGLHLAVREQLAIDRPPGVRDLHRALAAEYGDTHTAEHVLMQALGETLWEAQRRGAAADEQQYLALARRSLGRKSPQSR